jgi:hypothetical protein
MNASVDHTPNILRVKKDAIVGHQFRYNRDERLALKSVYEGKEKIKRQRVRKVNMVLLVVLGAAIAVLVFVILYKYIV